MYGGQRPALTMDGPHEDEFGFSLHGVETLSRLALDVCARHLQEGSSMLALPVPVHAALLAKGARAASGSPVVALSQCKGWRCAP